MIRKFEVYLDKRSIKNLIKDLKEYKNKTLKDKMVEFLDELSFQGSAMVQSYIRAYDAIDTYQLFNSIETRKKGKYRGYYTYYIVANNEHACFVEFGTGSNGLADNYPYPLPKGVKWNYNIGKTIFTTQDGRTGWLFPADDGNWYFTEGMPARPFMHDGFEQLVEEVERIATEVFNR